jgi:hypothetical protein
MMIALRDADPSATPLDAMAVPRKMRRQSIPTGAEL